jgi:hypothetical protein
MERGTVTKDKELVAITRIAKLLEALSMVERDRVLTFIYQKYPLPEAKA